MTVQQSILQTSWATGAAAEGRSGAELLLDGWMDVCNIAKALQSVQRVGVTLVLDTEEPPKVSGFQSKKVALLKEREGKHMRTLQLSLHDS